MQSKNTAGVFHNSEVIVFEEALDFSKEYHFQQLVNEIKERPEAWKSYEKIIRELNSRFIGVIYTPAEHTKEYDEMARNVKKYFKDLVVCDDYLELRFSINSLNKNAELYLNARI